MKLPRRMNRSGSGRQEAEAAKLFGGETQKGSGSGPYQKGDVRVKGKLRIECKQTKYSSFRITEEMIDKIEADAFGSDEVPVIEVLFLNTGKKAYVLHGSYIEGILPCF